MRHLNRFVLFPLFVLCAFALPSCSKIIGYSVVLWTVPELELADGEIVPVYVKSNISQQYIIGIGDGKEKKEVPLWKLSEPVSKKKAIERSEYYAEFLHSYAKCVLDGLPIRSDPENGSKQVYRLRQDEVIRTLARGNGVIPTNGKENLKGEWLEVLTSDGTRGWCFSLNLRLFTMNADGSYGAGAEEAEVQQQDDTLDAFLKSSWYPDYYAQMINRNRIELEYMSMDYGFDTGSSTGTVSLKLSTVDVSYPFAGVSRLRDGMYQFNGTPLQVSVRGAGSIVVQYTDASGKPKTYSFVTLPDSVDLAKVLAKEQERRDAVYASLRSLGPEFSSSNYGTLSFDGGGRFTWNDFALLVPSVIARSAGHSGTVSVKYFLPANLKDEWHGVLTFAFEGMDREVNFFYRKVNNGIRLSVARVSITKDSVNGRSTATVSQGDNSLVMFFHN